MDLVGVVCFTGAVAGGGDEACCGDGGLGRSKVGEGEIAGEGDDKGVSELGGDREDGELGDG